MRKSTTIAILFLFLLNYLGYFPVLKLFQHKSNQVVKTLISKNDSGNSLTLIDIRSDQGNQVRWLDDNEFIFQDEIYDLVRTEKDSNGIIRYYCLKDEKEQKVLDLIGEELGQNTGERNNSSQKSENPVKSLLKDYLPVNNSRSLIPFISTKLLINKGFNFTSIEPDVLVPPPKFC